MAATGLNLNWSSIQFGSTTYTKVTGGQSDQGGNILTFSGDTNIFPIIAAAGVHNPTYQFTLGDVGAAEGLHAGDPGTLVMTLKDAKGATGGGVVFTITSAVVQNVQSSGQHAQWASSTVSFIGLSSDGTTPPCTISRTP